MPKRPRKPKPDPEPPRKGFLTREDFHEADYPKKKPVRKPSVKRGK